MSTDKLTKPEVRKDILAQRMAQSKEEVVVKSAMIRTYLGEFIRDPEVKVVMAYLPFRKEVDLMPMMEELWRMGKKVVIPVCAENFALIPSELRNFEEDLCHGMYNILEPKEDKMRPIDPKEIDLLFVPGVAFDKVGNRLGYGAGYYDRFVERLRPDVKRLAMAFDLQIVDNAFPDDHDQPMDCLITESGIITCSLRQSCNK